MRFLKQFSNQVKAIIQNIAAQKLLEKINIQLLIVIAAALFLLKLFFLDLDSIWMVILNELLVIFIIVLIFLSLQDLLKYGKQNLLSHVINVGILNAMMFFMISFSDTILKLIYSNLGEKIKNPDILYLLISFLYVSIFICSLAYIFLVFKYFYFTKQKKETSIYFNTLIIFFLLTLSTSFLSDYKSVSYINKTFFIISIVLFIITSLRISWIAFLSKKQKISLLVLSVIILILFVLNLTKSGDGSEHYKLIEGFSPSVNMFLQLIMIYGVVYFSILFFTTLFHIPTAEAYDRKTREISSLQYFSRLITQVLDFNELAETITEIAVKVCNADASWIALKYNNGRKVIANKNINYQDASALTQFFLNKQKLFEQNRSDKIFNLSSTKNSAALSENFSALTVSLLRVHNEIKGYLFAVKRGDLFFDEEDKNALDTFADYASVAIENADLLEKSIEKERLEKELDVAREIQRKILPAENPKYIGLEISATFIPAFEVGGDYYDFFEIDSDRLAFVIADVSGKGISAAFVMAEVKGIFESLSKISLSPKEILTRVNQILKKTLDKKSFVSAAFGIIDLREDKLLLARAGHCPLLLVRDGKALVVRPSGMGLGLNFTSYFNQTLEEIKLDLKSKDVVILYTDGVTEAKNSLLEDFGEKNLEQVVIDNSNLSADNIANEIIKNVTLFSQNTTQHDDITLVIFKYK